jgi:hypothetical protein
MQRETDLHGMILLYNGQEPKKSDSPSALWTPNAMRQPRGEPQSEAERFSTSAARNCSALIGLGFHYIHSVRSSISRR